MTLARFIAMAALGFALYWGSLHGEFHMDDEANIRGNPHVHTLRELGTFFADASATSEGLWNQSWRPLTCVAHAICWSVAGGATWPFHLYKIILHVLCAWLSFLITRRLLARGPPLAPARILGVEVSPEMIAYAGALLFLVHPGNTETVCYISATSALQCDFFYLLAFWLFLGRRSSILIGAAYLAALLTKEDAITFPLAVLLWRWIDREGKERFRIFGGGGLMLVLAQATFVYLVPYLMLSREHSLHAIELPERYRYLCSQFWSWNYYLLWIFRPWAYNGDHTGYPFAQGVSEPRVIVGVSMTAVLVFSAVRWRRKQPFLAFTALWHYLTLLPSGSLFPLGSVIEEYRCYLSYALVLPALAASPFLLIPRARSWLPQGILGAILAAGLALGTLTLRQIPVWRSERSLWAESLRQDPTRSYPALMLGIQHLKLGENDQATVYFQKCIDASPGYAHCHLGKFYVKYNARRYKEASEELAIAGSLEPDNPMVSAAKARFLGFVDRNLPAAYAELKRCETLWNHHSTYFCDSARTELDALARPINAR